MVPVPLRDAPPLTRAVVFRAIGFAVAVVLGAIAIWMIVTGTDQKGIKIGFLAGLWGVLLGAYSMFGSRRQGDDAGSRTEVPVLPSSDVELRSSGEVERIAEAAARRAFEERLQAMIRSEVTAAMSHEVADLRGEIARLRGDLVEKVGGQLRLERIETTRLIGSDLEALQHEVRQLKAASESGTLLAELGLGDHSVREIIEPAMTAEAVRTVTEVKPQPSLHKSDRAEGKADKSARKRAAAEKAEAERLEAERLEGERAEAERAEAERAEAERAEAGRAEAERAEAEREATGRRRPGSDGTRRGRAHPGRAAGRGACRDRTGRGRAAGRGTG